MTQGIDEQNLLSRLRGGQDEAFSELFELHAPAVRRLARGIAADHSEAEDITAETFFRVLRAIKRGKGPNDNVRGYLLTVARRVAWEWKGASHDVPVSDDELTSRAGVSEFNASRTAEHTLITRAFTSLPERWRTVLWQTEVEGEQPAAVGPKFGLSANATAALARRARQGLRAAYLQAHLATNKGAVGCRSVLEKLGSYTAGSVTGAEASRISAHLSACSGCRSTHDELRDVCHSLRAHSGAAAALPALVGVGAGTAAGSSPTGAGFSGAMKTAFGGAKVKIGAAVASTAVVGVLGFTAGPVLSDSAVDILGLNGRQGLAEMTVERSTGANPSPNGGPTSGERTTRHGADRWGLPDEKETTEKSESNEKASATKQRERTAHEPSVPEQRKGTLAGSPADQHRGASDAARSPSTTQPSKPTRPEDKAAAQPPATKTQQPSSTTQPTSTTQQAPDGGTSTTSTASRPAHDCVDDYDYYERYNDQKRRHETYEYSYQNGEGYERYEYRYDNGRYESYETYWWDDC